MIVVNFRTPIEADAGELRRWFDKRVQGDWSIVLGVMSASTLAKGVTHWREREAFFSLAIQCSALFPKATVTASFENDADAMLFKLTWS